MQDELITLILETLQGMNEGDDVDYSTVTSDTALFGPDGVLDSIGLVTLIVAVEQAVEDRYGAVVALADEKAFSQKNSPFRTAASLAEYAARLVHVEEQ